MIKDLVLPTPIFRSQFLASKLSIDLFMLFSLKDLSWELRYEILVSARKSILATMDTKLFIGQVTQNRFLFKKKFLWYK